MLILLSPAKSLDYDTPLQDQPHSAPLFVKQSKALIAVLRDYAPPQISELMSLSDNLALPSLVIPRNAQKCPPGCFGL